MNDWQEIEEIFHAASELAGHERAAYLDEQCAGKPELRAEVETLLEQDLECQSRLGALVSSAATLAAAAQPKRAGPYRIIREIGQGGMGTVYLAERDDEHYRQQVALKLVRPGMDFAEVLERFRRERQILANLQHPNIARLLDGGATADGHPYLVIEFIDGESIKAFAKRKQLTPQQIASLMIPICDAVAFAHRNLVVHRDIKPGNILVDQEGTPKLLDFGIARLIEGSTDDSAAGATRNWMTPEYASPEQREGKPVTTASDIYSLGAVLHELLTGERPSGNEPGSSRRLKPNDLATIVTTTLRPEPERRYASADALRSDLQNFLEDRPIQARGDSTWYQLRKFASRHRRAVTAAAVMTLIALAGVVSTIWQARRAAAAGARAEKRFNEVRNLAKTFLFEFHDKVLELPNSTGVRQLIVERSLEYLDRLSQETPDDVALQRELAAAYERVGDLMDSPQRQNLGRTAEARASWQKAIAIVRKLRENNLANAEDLLLEARDHCHIGRSLMLRDQKIGQSLEYFERCRDLAGQAAATGKLTPDQLLSTRLHAQQFMVDAYGRLGRQDEAIKIGDEAIHLVREYLAHTPSLRAKTYLSSFLNRMVLLYSRRNQVDLMLKYGREGSALARELFKETPDAYYKRSYLLSLSLFVEHGMAARERGYPVPSLEKEAREQLALARELKAEDPLNDQAEVDYYHSCSVIGSELMQTKPSEARQYLEEALRILEKRSQTRKANLGETIAAADARQRLDRLAAK